MVYYMAATTFNFDDKTEKTLEELKKNFRLPSKTAVLRRALALLAIADKNRDPDGNITVGSGENRQKIIVTD
jgi:hypothetical protein